MKKSDFVKQLKDRLPEMNADQAEKAFDAVFDTIADAMKSGEKVDVRGFGSFSVRDQAARKARNPATGETIDVPAKKAPAFKAGKQLKDALNAA
ncbi:HU family DNA-binding protein [Sulfitobacter sp. R18_1]|uniref:HU family DNA-binding protein n=1 Tax=Sulfitobacter sp. R18_1 TaxID=2821104 RepID=UPI001ADAEB29|nr:HU family DNA-binding protein [Sulfitobacter sp. R18_1]MBO9428338.1 integration host factor subunit beta [Sulfitobacter sp. R18_1]